MGEERGRGEVPEARISEKQYQFPMVQGAEVREGGGERGVPRVKGRRARRGVRFRWGMCIVLQRSWFEACGGL